MKKPDQFILLALLIMGLVGCSNPPQKTKLDESEIQEQPVYPLPAGTIMRVKLYHPIDIGRVQSGDSFVGSLAAPVHLGDKLVLPQGTVVRGIVEKIAAGGSVTLTLDRLDWKGDDVALDTNSVTWTRAEHGKRDIEWVGRSAVAGALIAPSGQQQAPPQARIPADSVFTFRLNQPIAI